MNPERSQRRLTNQGMQNYQQVADTNLCKTLNVALIILYKDIESMIKQDNGPRVVKFMSAVRK